MELLVQNNGDGTYTINGTATQNTDFTFFDNLEKYQHLKNRTVKLVGCPKGGSDTTYRLMLQLQKAPWPSAIDIGKGSSVTVDNNDNWACWIRIYKDATVSNLTFKPMLVFDDKTPNATYDDFVPYTGDGDTLTSDVAEIKNDLDNKNCGYMDFSTNWNNVTKTGLYNYNGWGGTGGGSNRPTDTKCIGVLMVANTDNTTMISQTFISKDMKVYIRIYSDGAWDSWGTTS